MIIDGFGGVPGGPPTVRAETLQRMSSNAASRALSQAYDTCRDAMRTDAMAGHHVTLCRGVAAQSERATLQAEGYALTCYTADTAVSWEPAP